MRRLGSTPYLWSWGGKEVEADGKSVVLNSQETVESVKFVTRPWKESCDEGGLAWDDTSNNRAFSVGQHQCPQQKRKPDSCQTEKGAPLWLDILHARIPKGPGGQFNLAGPYTDMVMGCFRNQKPAKDFLRWIHSKPVFSEWFASQQGFSNGATRDWEKDKVWDADPVLRPFRDIPPFGRLAGYAGPPNRHAEVHHLRHVCQGAAGDAG